MPRHGLVGCLIIAGLLVVAPAAPASFSGANGDIVFGSDRDGNREVYVMRPDGSLQSNLTRNPARDDFPAAPPPTGDTRTVFASDRSGTDDLWFVDAFANTTFNLGTSTANESQPAIGSNVAMSSHVNVWVSDRDGNNELYMQGVNRTNNAASDVAPTWSPAYTKVGFASDRDGNSEIYAMNIDGSGVTRLTNDGGTDSAPNWSPDGSKIAFESNRDGNFEVYVMNADGSGLVNLSNDSASDRQPAWSPAGGEIVFQSNRDGNFEIYKMNADGSGQTRLTNSPGADVNPDWAARNPTIAYARPRGATPLRVALVPAFESCTVPNRTHGAPLSFPSCNEINPTTSNPYAPQVSSHATIGSPDSNGAAANANGFALLKVVEGDRNTPEDETDVILTMRVIDVRCFLDAAASYCGNVNTAGGRDYSGSLEVVLPFRLTDHENPPAADNLGYGTVEDASIAAPAVCGQTTVGSIGSTCILTTTFDAILPGAAKERARSIWELGPIEVRDGGADGAGSTPGDNERFLTQGVFVP